MRPRAQPTKKKKGSCSTVNSSPRLQVLAAQTLKIASINGLGDMEKLETELEDEIRWEENRHPPREIIGRFWRRCEEVLHSKPMLLFVILLNTIDCLLVMGELALDFFHVSNRFLAQTEHTELFLATLKAQYSPQLDDLYGVEEENLTLLYNHFLHSFIVWNASQYSPAELEAECSLLSFNHSSPAPNVTMDGSNNNSSINVLSSMLTFIAAPQEDMGPMAQENYDIVKIGHGLHYASISILSFLLFETLLKIASVGKRFFKKRMEMFDAVIILISFTLDVVFVEGLTNLNLQNFVIILMFLLPWRVLRVLNSLVVAVMAQHRLRLKLLYKQKRKVTKQSQESTDRIKVLEKQIEILRKLCGTKGVLDWEINKALGQTLSTSGQDGGLKTLSKLVFHAAESFAPLPGSPFRDPTVTELFGESSSTPSITVQCNGDVERGPSNGHVPTLEEEAHTEDETDHPGSSKGDRPKKKQTKAQTRMSRTKEEDDDDVDENNTEEEEETEEEPASPKLTFYLPVDAPVSGDIQVSNDTSVSEDAEISAGASKSKDLPVSTEVPSSVDTPESKDTQVSGDGSVSKDASVSGDAPVSEDTTVSVDIVPHDDHDSTVITKL